MSATINMDDDEGKLISPSVFAPPILCRARSVYSVHRNRDPNFGSQRPRFSMRPLAGSFLSRHGSTSMRRVCFLLKIKTSAVEEYTRVHADIWPEMLEA